MSSVSIYGKQITRADPHNRVISRCALVSNVPSKVTCGCGETCIHVQTIVFNRATTSRIKSLWVCQRCCKKTMLPDGTTIGIWS